jgi:hypothetical protein
LPDTLFGDYAKLFFTGSADDPFELRARADGRRLAIKSRRDYRADLEKYILPDRICEKSIALITRIDSIGFRDRLIDRFGFSRKTKRISRCLKTKPSRRNECLKTNNLAKTILVPLGCGANEVKDESQTGDFRSALPALSTGGEVRGIKWRDFDAENNVINIVREYIVLEGEKLPK